MVALIPTIQSGPVGEAQEDKQAEALPVEVEPKPSESNLPAPRRLPVLRCDTMNIEDGVLGP